VCECVFVCANINVCMRVRINIYQKNFDGIRILQSSHLEECERRRVRAGGVGVQIYSWREELGL